MPKDDKDKKQKSHERPSAKWIPFKGLVGQAAEALKKSSERRRRAEEEATKR